MTLVVPERLSDIVVLALPVLVPVALTEALSDGVELTFPEGVGDTDSESDALSLCDSDTDRVMVEVVDGVAVADADSDPENDHDSDALPLTLTEALSDGVVLALLERLCDVDVVDDSDVVDEGLFDNVSDGGASVVEWVIVVDADALLVRVRAAVFVAADVRVGDWDCDAEFWLESESDIEVVVPFVMLRILVLVAVLVSDGRRSGVGDGSRR